MNVTRRSFLKLSGAAAGTVAVMGSAAPHTAQARPKAAVSMAKRIGEITSICPYCGVGCGMIVASENGKIGNIEGDPDHPINQGALCAKGSAVFQVANNERRLGKVLYRAPGKANWEAKSWDWAITEIAKRVKTTRDATWVAKDGEGRVVNRTEAIAQLGGAAHDNEECYLLSKMARSLGLAYLEHQARI